MVKIGTHIDTDVLGVWLNKRLPKKYGAYTGEESVIIKEEYQKLRHILIDYPDLIELIPEGRKVYIKVKEKEAVKLANSIARKLAKANVRVSIAKLGEVI